MELFNIMLDEKCLEDKKCAAECPLYLLFNSYLEQVAGKGGVETIRRLQTENKNLKTKISAMKQGEIED
jgi:hypothetical protein